MRCVRSTLVTVLILAATAFIAAPTNAGDPPLPRDSTGIAGSWSLVPEYPCASDSVFLIVMGYVATPCDSFIGVERLANLHVRIRTLVRDGVACLVGPTIFYAVPVRLGVFPAGAYPLTVSHETTHLANDGSIYVETRDAPWTIHVSPECPGTPPPGVLPFVRRIRTEPPQPCVGTPTTLVLEGMFRDGCGRVVDARVIDPDHVELTLKPYVLPDSACPLVLKPWRQTFDLGLLPAGPRTTQITLIVLDVDSTGSGFRRSIHHGSHEFYVSELCEPIPPEPGPLPYVRHIFVGREDLCDPPPLCPRDSVSVLVSGVFPSDCFGFRRIELLPSLIVGPLPEPPIVRIIVDDGGCLGRPCLNLEVPWAGSVKLPPLPARDYQLMVELAQVSCSDTYPPGQLYRTHVPFAIADSCHKPPPCLTADFAPGRGNLSACNATISIRQPAVLTFLVRPNVALAGLEGEFKLYPSASTITRLEAIGPAEGMLLNWTHTGDRVRFVLFAEHGAPIPPLPPAPDPSVPVYPIGWPVLRVTVEHLARVEIPEVAVLTAENLLGSDINGQGVPICPPPPCVRFDPRPPSALICAERACDFNADGLEDVRDLVVMVHCVNGEGPCPPDAGTRFDCDHDNAFALSDVVCCARHMLQRPPCPDCPPDTTQVRPEPGVALSFGPPVETASGVDLPLRLQGADRMGAAMLTFDAPLDRYDLTGLGEVAGGRWLALHEVRGGQIVLGLVGTWSGDFAPSPILDLTLKLRLKPGEIPGGEVSAVAGEFSGWDGVRLAVDLGTPRGGLPGPAQLALSGSRPNPFSTETRFTLQLAEAAEVAVGIYDLRGRAVASLFRGRLPSGPQEFRWDGRRSDGTAAPDGVYFYHATVGAKTVARKLILMRDD